MCRHMPTVLHGYSCTALEVIAHLRFSSVFMQEKEGLKRVKLLLNSRTLTGTQSLLLFWNPIVFSVESNDFYILLHRGLLVWIGVIFVYDIFGFFCKNLKVILASISQSICMPGMESVAVGEGVRTEGNQLLPL